MFLHGGWQGNTLAALLTVVYVKVMIGLCEAGVTAGILAKDVSRKIVHLGAASWILFWPLFDQSHWTWRFNILVPAVFSVQLLIKGALVQDPNDIDVKTMSRTGDPRELLYGPLLFTLCMNCFGLFFFMKKEALYGMAALGYGDGIAPLIGSRWPLYRFRCPGGVVKSVGGFLAVFVGTLVGFVVFSRVLGILSEEENHDWRKVTILAAVAAVVESASPGDFDNVMIPLAVCTVHSIL